MMKNSKYNALCIQSALIIFILLFAAALYASELTLTWTEPTTNADGTPLTDLAGYKVYYGTESGNYSQIIDVGDVISYPVTGLKDGDTYYFAVTAYDTSGNESVYSKEYVKTISSSTSAPEITVTVSGSPVNNIAFGDVTAGNSSSKTVTVTNTGSADLGIGSIAQSNPLSTPFAISSDYCSGQTVTPSSTCTFKVRFSPESAVTSSDTFDIPSNDQDVTITLSGIGKAAPVPDITVTDSIGSADDLNMPFGDVTVDSSLSKTVTVTNTGNADLIIGSIAQTNPVSTPFTISNNTCSGQTVSTSSSCTFKVRFSPTSTDTFSNSFNIPSNDSDENPVTVRVSGTGKAAPVPDITVTDSVAPPYNRELPFGDVTIDNSSSQTITLRNAGNADLVIGSIAQDNPLSSPFTIPGNTCSGQTVSTASSCTITVRFSPTSTGSFSDSFDIPSNDADENPATIRVSGTGKAAPLPDITVTNSTASDDGLIMPFGELTEGLTSDQTAAITNNGTADLVIGNIAQSNQLEEPFSILDDNSDTCSGRTLEPSGTCTFTVRFSPVSTGSFNDSFDIPSNDTDENPVTISVSGTGLSSASNNPPTTPELIYPADQQKGVETTVEFKWKKSIDPDGDTVTYYLYYDNDTDFTDTTPIVVTSLENDNIYYAGIAGYGSGLLLFMIIPFLVCAGRNRKKILILTLTMIMAGMLLISCGDVSDVMTNIAAPFADNSSSSGSRTVSGLVSGTRYCWQIVAEDSDGGQSESSVNCFETK